MSEKKDLPHSKTVRGTLGNPKTQEAMKSGEKPPSMLGDPGSLKAEHLDSNPVPEKQRQDGGTVDLDVSGGGGGKSGSEGAQAGGRQYGGAGGADAEPPRGGVSKEENKNFEPREYVKGKKGSKL